MFFFATALASFLTSGVIGFYINDIQGPGYNPNCFTCPKISSFHHGDSGPFGITEKPDYAKLISFFNEQPFTCSYWVNGYTEKVQHHYVQPRFVGRCEYDSNGGLLSGNDECWKKAETNDRCAEVKKHNADKGNYLKKCDQQGCWYETAACYTCQKVKTDYVKIDTRNQKLECKYYTGDMLNDLCKYNSSTGALTGRLGVQTSPFQCPNQASQDIPCLERLNKDAQSKANDDAKRKAAEDRKKWKTKLEADKKQYLDEHGIFGAGCVEIMKDLLPPGPGLALVFGFGVNYIDVCKMEPEEVLKKFKNVKLWGAGSKIDQYIKGLELAIQKKQKA